MRTHPVKEGFHFLCKFKQTNKKYEKNQQNKSEPLGVIDCLWQELVPGHRKSLAFFRKSLESILRP